MFRLVTVFEEVQVVIDEVRLVRGKLDLHIELTPSLFLNPEGRVLENCIICLISNSTLTRFIRRKRRNQIIP